MAATIAIAKAVELVLNLPLGLGECNGQLPQIICPLASVVNRLLEGTIFDSEENWGKPNGHGRSNGWIAWAASLVERMGLLWTNQGCEGAPLATRGPRTLDPLLKASKTKRGVSSLASIRHSDYMEHLTGWAFMRSWEILEYFKEGDPLFANTDKERERRKEHLNWLTTDTTGMAARVGIPGSSYLLVHHNGWWEPEQRRLTPRTYCSTYPDGPDESEAASALRAELVYFSAADEVLRLCMAACWEGRANGSSTLKLLASAEKSLVSARLQLSRELPWMKSPARFYRRVEEDVESTLFEVVEHFRNYRTMISSESVQGNWPLGRILTARGGNGKWTVECRMKGRKNKLISTTEAAWWAPHKLLRYEIGREPEYESGSSDDDWEEEGEGRMALQVHEALFQDLKVGE